MNPVLTIIFPVLVQFHINLLLSLNPIKTVGGTLTLTMKFWARIEILKREKAPPWHWYSEKS
jgi:hypothetical protein